MTGERDDMGWKMDTKKQTEREQIVIRGIRGRWRGLGRATVEDEEKKRGGFGKFKGDGKR